MNFPMANKTFDLVRPLSPVGLGLHVMWSSDTKSAMLGCKLNNGTAKTVQLNPVKLNWLWFGHSW